MGNIDFKEVRDKVFKGCGCLTILILIFLLFAVLVFGGAITKVSPAQLPSPEILEHVMNI